ncbi:hypothetical protein [Mesorhizobium sp. ES1-4]|uniref:hypothetical protein n=1 Tax=Mesorhizobium sp. ES1-4 TaxID=2876627 RepID=UPI001CCF269C|nr:hypothetical protein [Mesorhizobium sp. ES1-4]MBZ9798738.1 hypothetical protein [Mesorhizobium sp. ES1-4]
MGEDDDLYERFRDLLQETPEAEDALRAYRKKPAMAVVAERLREKNQTALDETYEWWSERRRQGKQPHGED